MKVPILSIDVFEMRAEGPPRRQLELRCNVTNPASFDICILDAWVTVKTLNELKIAEGNLFYSMHNRIDPAVIPAGKKGLGAFIIELPAAVLQYIEERRAGGDIELVLSSRVLISNVSTVNGVKTLGVPFETEFGRGHTGDFKHLIPQSEWIKALKRLRWLELEILELPSSRLRANATLARALQRFEDARDCYQRGDWEETMLNCRKVFEAIIKDISGQDDMRKSSEMLKSLVGKGEKAERLDQLVKTLSNFLHLGRHEYLPPILIKRADAQLALHLTGALLVYLGEQ